VNLPFFAYVQALTDMPLLSDNIDGYIVPYFLVVGVVVFLVYATVRGRKDRITAKRDVHNV
jgi:hypothetical protein